FCPSFLQAADGIRDRNVTGVQTCALPIFCNPSFFKHHKYRPFASSRRFNHDLFENPTGKLGLYFKIGKSATASRRPAADGTDKRSEERRVGKEGRARPGSEELTPRPIASW